MPRETKAERERQAKAGAVKIIERAKVEARELLLARAKRDANVAATIKGWTKLAPMNMRFGVELADKLRAEGFDQPEELLFADAKLLKITAAEVAEIRKYQKRYLPKPSKRRPRRVKGVELSRVRRSFAANRNADVVEHPRTVWFTATQLLVLEGEGNGLLFET